MNEIPFTQRWNQYPVVSHTGHIQEWGAAGGGGRHDFPRRRDAARAQLNNLTVARLSRDVARGPPATHTDSCRQERWACAGLLCRPSDAAGSTLRACMLGDDSSCLARRECAWNCAAVMDVHAAVRGAAAPVSRARLRFYLFLYFFSFLLLPPFCAA